MNKPTLTQDQYWALDKYAHENGKLWKERLRNDWMTGKARGELQVIRNSFGPTWLKSFRFKK